MYAVFGDLKKSYDKVRMYVGRSCGDACRDMVCQVIY